MSLHQKTVQIKVSRHQSIDLIALQTIFLMDYDMETAYDSLKGVW